MYMFSNGHSDYTVLKLDVYYNAELFSSQLCSSNHVLILYLLPIDSLLLEVILERCLSINSLLQTPKYS